jgi:tetratricopeptide (TPR) repeat protein
MNRAQSPFQGLLSSEIPQEIQEDAKRRARGRMLRAAGVVWILLGAAVMAYTLVTFYGLPSAPSGILLGIGGAAAYKGFFDLRRARKYLAPNAEQLLELDGRSPVVYLRPFDSDDLDPDPPSALEYFLGAGDFEETLGAPEEEQLAVAMNELGPFIAIGKPYDILPKLGAARVRVSDDEWQGKVSEWVAHAQLILLRLGFTEGVEWELAHILEHASPQKLVLLLPFTPATGYDAFRERMRERFHRVLPEIKRRNWTPPLSVCGLMYFTSGWEAHFVQLKRPLLNRALRALDRMGRGRGLLAAAPRAFTTLFLFALEPRNWMTARYKRAFRPVIGQLGLRWKRPALTHLVKPIVVGSLLLSFLGVKAYQFHRNDEILALETEGERLNDAGQYDQAIQPLSKAIQMDPKGAAWGPLAFLSRAKAYEETKNDTAAIADYSAAIAIDAENYPALDGRCWLRAIGGQLNDALSDCNRALALKVDDAHKVAHTHESRALVYLKLNRFDDAIADYKTALDANFMLVDSQFGLGVAEVRAGDEIFGSEQMNQALELDAGVGARFKQWGVRVPKSSW